MPVQLSDLYTTVLNAALPRAVREPPADSRDLLAVAQGGDERRIAICECNGPAPVTTKLFERHTNPVVLHRATPQIAAVGPRFKLIKSADGQRELYDLIGDPGELHNLFEELPDEAQRLDAHIRTWLEATPVYTPPRNGERLPSPEVLRSLRGLGYAGDDD